MLDNGDCGLFVPLSIAARRGEHAEDVLPQIVRGHRLHGREDDVVDAGQQHEEDPVGQPQRVPVGKHGFQSVD